MVSQSILSVMFGRIILLLLLNGMRSTSGKDISRPHIIFIMADDMGWGDVGYHGSEIMTSSIDTMAREGIKLERYYTQSCCTPSRSVLMTGRHEVGLNWDAMDTSLGLAVIKLDGLINENNFQHLYDHICKAMCFHLESLRKNESITPLVHPRISINRVIILDLMNLL